MPEINALLDEKFVVSWALVDDLQRWIEEGELDAKGRALAEEAIAKYQYPVDSQLWSPAGDLLGQYAANDMFSSEPGKPAPSYLAFLRKALVK